MYDLSPRFVGMVGYYASLQSTLSGLSLVKDISVTCFMRGGNLVDFICAVLRLQKDRLAAELERGRRLDSELQEVGELLKNCKIRTLHLNQNKKFREFGKKSNVKRCFSRYCVECASLPFIARSCRQQPGERFQGRRRQLNHGGQVLPDDDHQGA